MSNISFCPCMITVSLQYVLNGLSPYTTNVTMHKYFSNSICHTVFHLVWLQLTFTQFFLIMNKYLTSFYAKYFTPTSPISLSDKIRSHSILYTHTLYVYSQWDNVILISYALIKPEECVPNLDVNSYKLFTYFVYIQCNIYTHLNCCLHTLCKNNYYSVKLILLVRVSKVSRSYF